MPSWSQILDDVQTFQDQVGRLVSGSAFIPCIIQKKQ